MSIDELRRLQLASARLEEEWGTGKAILKTQQAPEKLVDAVDELEDRAKAFKLQMVDREMGT